MNKKKDKKRNQWLKPTVSKLSVHKTKGGWNKTTESSNGVTPDFGGATGSTT